MYTGVFHLACSRSIMSCCHVFEYQSNLFRFTCLPVSAWIQFPHHILVLPTNHMMTCSKIHSLSRNRSALLLWGTWSKFNNFMLFKLCNIMKQPDGVRFLHWIKWPQPTAQLCILRNWAVLENIGMALHIFHLVNVCLIRIPHSAVVCFELVIPTRFSTCGCSFDHL